MPEPADIQLIGTEVAIKWSDGAESFFPADKLRAASPSAEQQGERDILGVRHGGVGGGHDESRYAGVSVLGWEFIGRYAVRFEFSDGHRTGLYTYDYLRELAARG